MWPRESLGDTALGERIALAESFYADRRLPPRFQLSPASAPPQLEAELQRLLAAEPATIEAGMTLVSREYRTDIGPVDLLCRDAQGRAVAVEVKRRATLDAVEQVVRYRERLDLDSRLRPVRALIVAQQVSHQARVLAAGYLGGPGTEWLVSGGFQPDGTVVVAAPQTLLTATRAAITTINSVSRATSRLRFFSAAA